LKILYIWDIGGDSYLAAKFQRKIGHEADVIKNSGYNPYGLVEFYGGKEFKTIFWVGEFYAYSILKAKRYDLIHVHCLYKMIPILRRLYPDKKIILHYHGTDCRVTPLDKRKKAEKMSDMVLLSTPDLKEYVPEGIYVPNPIDTELFKFKKSQSDNAFTILVRKNKVQLIQNYLKENNFMIDFKVHEAGLHPTPYSKMPELFHKYGIYIDLKFTCDKSIIPTLSNTGRQALSCGLKVLNHELKLLQGLPNEHYPENVAKKLEEIYAEL